MKLYKRILLAALSLCLALGIAGGVAACGKTKPKTIDYTVTVTCADETVLADVKAALQTPAGEAVEGGEAKALTDGVAAFSLLPATYKVVLSGVPETYEYASKTVSEEAPAANVALTLKNAGSVDPKTIDYTVTVTCADETVLADVKAALQTPAGEAVEGGEAKALTAGMATFSLLPATYKVVLSGVPETYEYASKTVSEEAPAANVALTKKSAGPQTVTYTVYLNLSIDDETALKDVKVALQTPAGEAVEGGEAKSTATDANFRVYASFEVAPGTYKVVLSGVPEIYEWDDDAEVSEASPTAEISFSHLAEYTVTVTCTDETVLASVKVSLRGTLDSSVPKGGEERALTNGTATFQVKAGTYLIALTGVPDTYRWSDLLVSDTTPARTVPLTEKSAEPPAPQDHLPAALDGSTWESSIGSLKSVTFSGDAVAIDGDLGKGTAEAEGIALSDGVWTFSFSLTTDQNYDISASFTYDEVADTLLGTNSPSRPLVLFTRHRETEKVTEFPAALVGTHWTPEPRIAGVPDISFTATTIFIGDGFVTPTSIAVLDEVYTFVVPYTASGVHYTMTFTYNAAEKNLTAVKENDFNNYTFTKVEGTVDPNSFGEVVNSLPEDVQTYLAAAEWTSGDDVVSRIAFEKMAANANAIYITIGKNSKKFIEFGNGNVRKSGAVYQIFYKAQTNITYDILLRFDTENHTLTALYGGKTVQMTRGTVIVGASYPAELEGTTWVNAEDPEGTQTGIRSITFKDNTIEWVDKDGNRQRVNSVSYENGTIYATVDYTMLPQGYFAIEYSGGNMTVHVANSGATSGFNFTKQ